MYSSKKVEISPGANVLCGVVHVPVAHYELCFVNAKAGLGLLEILVLTKSLVSKYL